jgi:hypothetical protein
MFDFDPAPYNEVYENGVVDNRDFSPVIIKNLISDEDRGRIYSIVDSMGDNFLFQKFAGHRAWAFKDEEFANKLNKVVTDLIGEPMVLTEYSFARYSPKFGYKPKLFPHYDTHFADGQRITVDIQMNKNVDWAVIVEGESFNFDVNDALIFSGTQQVHWREKKDLLLDDEVDMIFAHFAYANKKPWSHMQKEILEYKSHRLREAVGISNQPEPIDSVSV